MNNMTTAMNVDRGIIEQIVRQIVMKKSGQEVLKEGVHVEQESGKG